MIRKTHIALMTVVAIAIAAPSFAQTIKKPLDHRRTLSVVIAQKTLNFEAPKDMCFLDRSQPLEQGLFDVFSSMAAEQRRQVVIGVFAPCEAIMNMGGKNGVNGVPLNAGTIAWLNPAVGETTELPRQEYLDMREAGFPQYARKTAGPLKVDKKVHRGPLGITIGMTGGLKVEELPQKSAAVISTTTIRQIPVEITLRYTGDTAPALDKIYPLMDKLMAQQIALNE